MLWFFFFANVHRNNCKKKQINTQKYLKCQTIKGNSDKNAERENNKEILRRQITDQQNDFHNSLKIKREKKTHTISLYFVFVPENSFVVRTKTKEENLENSLDFRRLFSWILIAKANKRYWDKSVRWSVVRRGWSLASKLRDIRKKPTRKIPFRSTKINWRKTINK